MEIRTDYPLRSTLDPEKIVSQTTIQCTSFELDDGIYREVIINFPNEETHCLSKFIPTEKVSPAALHQADIEMITAIVHIQAETQ